MNWDNSESYTDEPDLLPPDLLETEMRRRQELQARGVQALDIEASTGDRAYLYDCVVMPRSDLSLLAATLRDRGSWIPVLMAPRPRACASPSVSTSSGWTCTAPTPTPAPWSRRRPTGCPPGASGGRRGACSEATARPGLLPSLRDTPEIDPFRNEPRANDHRQYGANPEDLPCEIA